MEETEPHAPSKRMSQAVITAFASARYLCTANKISFHIYFGYSIKLASLKDRQRLLIGFSQF